MAGGKAENRRARPGRFGIPGGAVLLLVFLMSVSSCGVLKQMFTGELRIRKSDPYHKVYEAWTREGRAYTGLSVDLLVHATLLSPPFREALLEKKSREYGYTPREREQFRARWRKEACRCLEFFVCAYVPDGDNADLGGPAWRIYVENEKGMRLVPAVVEKVSEPVSLLKKDYPHTTPWCTPYRVRFRTAGDASAAPFIPPEGGSVSLILTGPLGRVRMTWICPGPWPSIPQKRDPSP